MKEVPDGAPSNWFDRCIEIEDFMYARDTQAPEPAAFVEVECGIPNDSGNESSGTQEEDQ